MKRIAVCIGIMLCMLLCGCVHDEPVLMPVYTLPIEPTPTPAPTLTPTPTAVPTPSPTPLIDVTGVDIEGVDHFRRYLHFRNIQVYEQCEDTFVDALLVNDYPLPLMCAATVTFYEQEGGETIAEGKLQTRDGEYVLLLQPGETTVYAQIDTDMRLTDMPFALAFDASLGVLPA